MSIPAAYISIVVIWATTPLAIQWSSQGVDFTFAVCARMVIGLIVAGAILLIWRIGLPLHRRALHSYLAGGVGIFGAMSLSYWGAQHVHSGLISVIFGLAPLITGILAVLWLSEQALTVNKVFGMLLGLSGLMVIFANPQGLGDGQAFEGILAVLLGVSAYSASLVWMKRIGDDSPPLATTAGSLAISLPLFILLWVSYGSHLPSAMPPRSGVAIVYLGVFGSVLGFAMYFYVVKHLEAGKVALITLMTPVLALLLGNALNGEALTFQAVAGAVCIGTGLTLHQWSQFRQVVPIFARNRS